MRDCQMLEGNRSHNSRKDELDVNWARLSWWKREKEGGRETERERHRQRGREPGGLISDF